MKQAEAILHQLLTDTATEIEEELLNQNAGETEISNFKKIPNSEFDSWN